MSQTSPAATPSPVAAQPARLRALFLHERAAPADGPAGGDLAAAQARRLRWQRAALADDGAFAERLAEAGHTPDGFLAILAGGGCPAPAAAGPADACMQTAEALAAGRWDGVPLPPLPGTVPFGGFLEPFLRYGAHLLRDGQDALVRRRGLAAPPAAPAVEAELLRGLLSRLAPQCVPTLTLELNVARLLDLLEGDTPEARYAFFCREHLARPDVRRALLDEYAPLARLLVQATEGWAAASLEFLDRLEEDRPALERAFGGGRPLGALTEAAAGGSDPHRGGRTVVQARFASGVRLVYKPVSLAADERFGRLLDAVNAMGLRHPHRGVRALDRGEHGWMEFVRAAPCADRHELRRFYWRQGSHLAILHLLRAADFHHENVVAAGEHPVLLDLECLFHPQEAGDDGPSASAEAWRTLGRSVLQSALLPTLSRDREGRIGADLSGLGGEEGQAFARDARVLADARTDRMHVVAAAALTRGAANRPTLDGAAVRLEEFADDLVDGFRETYDLLARHRGAVAELLEAFADVEVRHLLRMTRHYMLFVREGFHPDTLRDALERDELLERLRAEATVRPALRRVVAAEQEDLRGGDVPRFTSRPGERHLRDSRGRLVPHFFPRSALDEARELLARMGPGERDRQAHLVRMALASVSPPPHVAPALPRPAPAPEEADAALLAAATAVGEWLREGAVHGGGGATWITLLMQPGDDPATPRRVIAPAHPHLYEGGAGIALFLAYLGRETGRGELSDLARRALATARHDLDRPGAPGGDMAGGFVGRGGHVYALVHLAALWRESALLDEALEMARAAAPLLRADRHLDVVSGVAGFGAAAVLLHRATGDARALEAVRACGLRLREAALAQPEGGAAWAGEGVDAPLPGFSHGAAGIAWALERMGAHTGDERLLAAARAGLAWERRAFGADPARATDRRVAWCHGAPGIALARLPLSGDPVAGEEIRRGMEAVLAAGIPADPCLCHGALGNADLLLSAARAGGDPAWGETARAWGVAVARQLLGAAGPDGRLPFAPSPGLMCGRAGVGMGLLRLRRPDAVPSVLSLEPPPAA